MTSKVIKIEDQDFLVGIDWSPIKNASEQSTVKKRVLETHKGSKFGIFVKPKIGTYAFGIATPNINKTPKCPSAAALLAFALQEQSKTSETATSPESPGWIFIEKLSEESFWLVAVKEGLPVPDHDIICNSLMDLNETISNLFSFTNFAVYSKDPIVREMAQFIKDDVQVYDRSFKNLIKNVKLSKGNLIQVSGLPITTVALIIGVFTLIGAGFWYSSWTKKQEIIAQEQKKAQQAADQKRKVEKARDEYEKLVKEALTSSLNSGVNSVKSVIKSPEPQKIMTAWTSILDRVKLNHVGWVMEEIDCGIKRRKAECTIKLSRGEIGNNRLLMEAFPNAEIKGDKATYTLIGDELVNRQGAWRDILPANRMSVGMLSELQFLRLAGLDYRQRASKEIIQPVNLPEPPRLAFKSRRDVPKDVAPIKIGAGKGDLTISGDVMAQLYGLGEFLEYSNVSLNSLKLDPEGSWQLKIDYVVKTAPEPIIPVVAGPKGDITIELPEEFKAVRGEEGEVGNLEDSQGQALMLPSEQAEEDKKNQGQSLRRAPVSLDENK